MRNFNYFLFVFITFFTMGYHPATAQQIEKIPFGDLDRWVTRSIKESALLGGKTKELYEIGPTKRIEGSKPFVQDPSSPWATSSVMANVAGIIKTSCTVFPEKRGDGYCARLETRFETCKVLGIVNISVLASGTIFLGEVPEPIRNTSNPQSKLMMGVPFTKRPNAVQFDYKVQPGTTLTKATGFSKIQKLAGHDSAEVCILLQNRWEDQDGNIYAKRVGTGYQKFGKAEPEWINNFQVPIYYGNISKRADFKEYMNIIPDDDPRYCKNSKGKIVAVKEVGWADATDAVTHIILRFSAGDKGAYIGCPDSKFWVDNIVYVY